MPFLRVHYLSKIFLAFYNRAVRQLQNHVDEEDDVPKGKKRRMNNHVNNHAPVEDAIITTGGTKVLALPTGPVLVNLVISRLFDVVKPQIRQLVEYANLVGLISYLLFHSQQ